MSDPSPCPVRHPIHTARLFNQAEHGNCKRRFKWVRERERKREKERSSIILFHLPWPLLVHANQSLVGCVRRVVKEKRKKLSSASAGGGKDGKEFAPIVALPVRRQVRSDWAITRWVKWKREARIKSETRDGRVRLITKYEDFDDEFDCVCHAWSPYTYSRVGCGYCD